MQIDFVSNIVCDKTSTSKKTFIKRPLIISDKLSVPDGPMSDSVYVHYSQRKTAYLADVIGATNGTVPWTQKLVICLAIKR